MKYYVPVGPGGVFFRVGMAVTGMMGSVVYWRASCRRGAAILMEFPSPASHPGPDIWRAEAYGAIAAGSSHALSASRGAAVATIDR
jgi:hypothetical protein